LAGRKSKADIKEPNAYLPIEIYTISTALIFKRGAKREYIENGKPLYDSTQMRMHFGGQYIREELNDVIDYLEKLGYKKIKAHKKSINLPSKCPSCERKGTPTIQTWIPTMKVKSKFDTEQKPPTKKLVYGHSSKPKTCLIGTLELDRNISIKLKKGLPIDSLGFRRRTGTYPL